MTVDADAHVARDPVHQGLGGKDVFDFRGADAKAQRPQRAIGGGVAVAAQHHHARQDHAVLGRDHVLDALQRIGGVEQRDALLVAIALEIAGLARRGIVGNHAQRGRHRMGGNDVIHHRHLLAGPQRLAAARGQAAEGLRTGVLVHDVQIHVQQDVFIVDAGHLMAGHQLVV